jgi:hypothetical protein
MSLPKTVLIVLAALLLASLCACGQESQKSHTHDPSSAIGTSWVELPDLSGSTVRLRIDELDEASMILRCLQPGDELAILAIQQASIADAQYLYQGTVPRFVFYPDPAPRSDNPLVLATYKTKEQRRSAAGQAQFDRSHNLTAELARIRARIAPAVLHERARGTDIFGALQLAGELFSTTQGPHRLVIFSDGLECDVRLDFARTPPSVALMARLAASQRRRGELPDLHGAQVLFVGPGRDDPAVYSELCRAWCCYINRYADGHLEARFFQSALSDQLLAAWLANSPGD